MYFIFSVLGRHFLKQIPLFSYNICKMQRVIQSKKTTLIVVCFNSLFYPTQRRAWV